MRRRLSAASAPPRPRACSLTDTSRRGWLADSCALSYMETACAANSCLSAAGDSDSLATPPCVTAATASFDESRRLVGVARVRLLARVPPCVFMPACACRHPQALGVGRCLVSESY